MKKIMFLTCIGTLTLALTAWGAPEKPAAKSAKRAPAVSAKGGGHSMSHASQAGPMSHMSHAGPMRTSRGFSNTQMRTSRMATSRASIHGRNNVAITRERNINRANSNTLRNSRESTLRNSRMETARTAKADARIANANARTSAGTNAAMNRNANVKGATNQAAIPQTNTAVVNNWRSLSGQDYAAFRDYSPQWHDRTWWDSNYTRIILVGGGWWFWDAGYWYPAWGYDPSYTYYPYDGPIYGYRDLTPDRVIINVQRELRTDGYYAGTVDGVLGPQTRHAIAAFQADHGLAVTSALDQPTL